MTQSPSGFVYFDGEVSGEWEPTQPLDFERNTITMRVDAALLPGYVPSPEEQARLDRFLAERAALQPGYAEAIRALDAVEDPVSRLVLDLHQRKVQPYTRGWVCEGCDSGPGAEDYTEWPCSTVLALCGHYGLGLDVQAPGMLQRPEDGSLDAGE